MRKSVTYLTLGVSAAFVVIAATFLMVSRTPDLSAEDVLALYEKSGTYDNLTIHYPLDETLFPPDIVAPTFRWEDDDSGADTWLITITFQDDKDRINVITRESKWTPEPEQWETIKTRSLEKDAEVTILGAGGYDVKLTRGSTLPDGAVPFQIASEGNAK